MLYRLFIKAMDIGIVEACKSLPKNLRQYYANQLLLMRVRREYGL